jgi:microcin C transport system permease protein
MNNSIIQSDSILKKRIRKFKSIKRAYYSFILIIVAYLFSLCATLFVNSTALLIYYGNDFYDQGEEYVDINNNKMWDDGEYFVDQKKYYFPLFKKLFQGIEYEAS